MSDNAILYISENCDDPEDLDAWRLVTRRPDGETYYKVELDEIWRCPRRLGPTPYLFMMADHEGCMDGNWGAIVYMNRPYDEQELNLLLRDAPEVSSLMEDDPEIDLSDLLGTLDRWNAYVYFVIAFPSTEALESVLSS